LEKVRRGPRDHCGEKVDENLLHVRRNGEGKGLLHQSARCDSAMIREGGRISASDAAKKRYKLKKTTGDGRRKVGARRARKPKSKKRSWQGKKRGEQGGQMARPSIREKKYTFSLRHRCEQMRGKTQGEEDSRRGKD